LQVFDFVQAKFAILMDFGFFLMTAENAEGMPERFRGLRNFSAGLYNCQFTL
jgi:hypothetical protein